MRARERVPRRLIAALAAAVPLVLSIVGAVTAHPIGNFTINHYAGIWLTPTSVSVDYVLDMAEIPTFGERDRMDTNGDGTVDAAEQERERLAACPRTAPQLDLRVAGSRLMLTAVAAGVSFPVGTTGYDTLRLVCEFDAALPEPIAARTTVAYHDDTWADRIGWREIVVGTSGLTVVTAGVATTSTSDRLKRYPADLIDHPLEVASLTFAVTPGGPTRPQPAIHDASALPGAAPRPSGASVNATAATTATAPAPAPAVSTVPAPITGADAGLASLVDFGALSPAGLAFALLVAAALGALHGLSPGHGKTIGAAYLIGSHGSIRNAAVLGLAVAASHTIGVAVLALLTIAATGLIAPERLYPALGVASGVLAVALGLGLLWGAWFRVGQDGDHGHGHDHAHAHDHDDDGASLPAPARGPARRTLVTLGLIGGLVPSASALLLLLAAIAARQPAVGLLLVVAYGIGMAVALVGAGIVAIRTAHWLKARTPGRAERVADILPVASAMIVIAAGVLLAVGSVGGVATVAIGH